MMDLVTRITRRMVSSGPYYTSLASDLICLADVKNLKLNELKSYISFLEDYEIKNKTEVQKIRKEIIKKTTDFLNAASKGLSLFHITKILIYLGYMSSNEKDEWKGIIRNKRVAFCIEYIKMIRSIQIKDGDIIYYLNNLKKLD